MLNAQNKMKEVTFTRLIENGIKFERLSRRLHCFYDLECPSAAWELVLPILMTGEVSGGPCLIGVFPKDTGFQSCRRSDELLRYFRSNGMLELMCDVNGSLVGSITRVCVPVLIETCQNPPVACPHARKVRIGNHVCRIDLKLHNVTFYIDVLRTRKPAWIL